MDILGLHQDGFGPEQIVKEFPTLSGSADVYAALLYYHDHKSEIDADVQADQVVAQRYERESRGR